MAATPPLVTPSRASRHPPAASSIQPTARTVRERRPGREKWLVKETRSRLCLRTRISSRTARRTRAAASAVPAAEGRARPVSGSKPVRFWTSRRQKRTAPAPQRRAKV